METATKGVTIGLANTILLQPFDVIRTRQQQYNMSLLKVVRTIHPRQYYNGTTPTLLRNTMGYAAYFTVLRSYNNSLPNTHLGHFLSATLSRATCGILFAPLTLLKTRLEGTVDKLSLTESISHILKNQGFKGFYNAVGTTMARDTLYSGLYYCLYRYFQEEQVNHSQNCIQSALMALFVTHPLDTIKTRKQLHLPVVYGRQALFVGFLPRAIRRCCQALITWTIFDKI